MTDPVLKAHLFMSKHTWGLRITETIRFYPVYKCKDCGIISINRDGDFEICDNLYFDRHIKKIITDNEFQCHNELINIHKNIIRIG